MIAHYSTITAKNHPKRPKTPVNALRSTITPPSKAKWKARQSPATAYNNLPKAEPAIKENGQIWRVRHDKVGPTGILSYRYVGQLKHLGIGRAHQGKTVLASGPHTPETNYQPKPEAKKER